MHPAIRCSRVGTASSPINYNFHHHVMPCPPPQTKGIHDWVIEEILTPDFSGRKPPEWNGSTKVEFAHKFSREQGHFALNNICTVERLFNKPELKRFLCWYFPRRERSRGDLSTLYKISRASSMFAKPDLWGEWNVSTELPNKKERYTQLASRLKTRRQDIEEVLLLGD
eukprot:c21819_g2_i3 orf=260-766(+)